MHIDRVKAELTYSISCGPQPPSGSDQKNELHRPMTQPMEDTSLSLLVAQVIVETTAQPIGI
jgi:hypothetical protein